MSRTKRPKVGEAWELPPTEKPDWRAVAEELREHPLEWLRVRSHAPASWANAISRGHVRPLRADLGFQVRTRDNTRDHPRTCTLYLRFDPDRVDPLAELVSSRRS